MTKRFSIILPVLNERDLINPLLDHLESLEGSENCEFIVVDGSPDGGTIKAVTRQGVQCIKSPQGPGKPDECGGCHGNGRDPDFSPCRYPAAATGARIDQPGHDPASPDRRRIRSAHRHEAADVEDHRPDRVAAFTPDTDPLWRPGDFHTQGLLQSDGGIS